MTSRRSLESCDCTAMTMDPTMLDLSNIQGNILRGYASFPHAQFLYLSIHSADDARAFVQQLLDNDSVTPAQWRVKPDATLNLALTFDGLRAFGLPEDSLATFPSEFQQGMRLRAKALGDVGDSSPDKWEEPWKMGGVHMLVMVYGTTPETLEARCRTLRGQLPRRGRGIGTESARRAPANRRRNDFQGALRLSRRANQPRCRRSARRRWP